MKFILIKFELLYLWIYVLILYYSYYEAEFCNEDKSNASTFPCFIFVLFETITVS